MLTDFGVCLWIELVSVVLRPMCTYLFSIIAFASLYGVLLWGLGLLSSGWNVFLAGVWVSCLEVGMAFGLAFGSHV